MPTASHISRDISRHRGLRRGGSSNLYPGQAGISAPCAEWYAGDDFPHGKYRDRKAGGIGAARHALFSAFDEAKGRIDYLGGHLKKATALYTAEPVHVPVQGGKIGLRYDAAAGIDVWDLEA